MAASHPKSYLLIVAICNYSFLEMFKPIQPTFSAIIHGEIGCEKIADSLKFSKKIVAVLPGAPFTNMV